ncbi:MAG: hypothetical protein CR988_05695 [Treponema sp.]|nr:MAG: hypothetical protein CR988_05695 [Treponema sp.]
METGIELAKEIKKLSVDLNLGKLKISVSDDDSFSYKIENADEDDFQVLQTETEILITDKRNVGDAFKSKIKFGDVVSKWFNKEKLEENRPKIKILIPEGYRFEEVKIKGALSESNVKGVSADVFKFSAGVGNVKLKNIKADSLKIVGGVGKISGKNIISKKTKVDAGVGPCYFVNSEFSESKLNCGVGQFKFDGNMFGKNSLRAGVGSVELSLNSKLSEVNLYVKAGIGRIKVNDETISGLNAEKEFISDSSDRIKVIGNLGKIDIAFNE